jgi:hypothetical protein
MRLKLSCRDVTHLVLQAEDRRLSFADRLRVRLHLLVCRACPRFVRQVRFMRSAMGRWRRYAEGDVAPPEA